MHTRVHGGGGVGKVERQEQQEFQEIKVLFTRTTVTDIIPTQLGYSGHIGQKSACPATNGVFLPFIDPQSINQSVRD